MSHATQKAPYPLLYAPTTLYLGTIGVCLTLWHVFYPASLYQALLVVAAGLILWTLFEYVMHRYLLHAHQLPRGFKNAHRHFHHHGDSDNPWDIAFNVYCSVPLFSLVFGLFLLFTRSLGLTLLLFPGFLGGYLLYEWVHMGAHFHHTQISFLKRLYAYHLKHHHGGEKAHFGVTTTLWDHIFRTAR